MLVDNIAIRRGRCVCATFRAALVDAVPRLCCQCIQVISPGTLLTLCGDIDPCGPWCEDCYRPLKEVDSCSSSDSGVADIPDPLGTPGGTGTAHKGSQMAPKVARTMSSGGTKRKVHRQRSRKPHRSTKLTATSSGGCTTWS